MARIFSRLIAAAMIAAIAVIGATEASARVKIKVDVSQQRMKVYRHGKLIYNWPVSTGRRGYRTPRGTFRPKWLSKHHRSRKYNNAPMPNSIFFYGGYAIHGTYATKRLGRPASHGCIRLAPGNARRLFNLVRKNMSRTTIRIRS